MRASVEQIKDLAIYNHFHFRPTKINYQHKLPHSHKLLKDMQVLIFSVYLNIIVVLCDPTQHKLHCMYLKFL